MPACVSATLNTLNRTPNHFAEALGDWYQGAEAAVVLTPCKGKDKPEPRKQASRSHAKLRGPGERANAQLKSWRIIRKLRCCPSRAGWTVKAIAVLQNHRVAHEARG